MQFFKLIKDASELKQMIVDEGLADSKHNVSDQMVLKWLRQRYDNFLIVDYNIGWVGKCDYVFDFKLTNSFSNEVVLQISYQVTNWSGLDKPLIYPMLNALKDWIDENKNAPLW